MAITLTTISFSPLVSYFSFPAFLRSQSITFQIDVDRQRADFLHQHVERLRHAGIDLVLALDDVLVHLGAAGNVVRLHRQHFLQGVSRAVSFQRPDFHFAETLTTELRLAAQRLLGHQRVRTGGTGVHLVVDQVMQLQHMHDADGDRAVERLAAATVIQLNLRLGRREADLLGARIIIRIGQIEHGLDLFLGSAVEHRRRERHALGQIAGHFHDLGVGQALDVFLLAGAL
jgi:hypothetical protein